MPVCQVLDELGGRLDQVIADGQPLVNREARATKQRRRKTAACSATDATRMFATYQRLGAVLHGIPAREAMRHLDLPVDAKVGRVDDLIR